MCGQFMAPTGQGTLLFEGKGAERKLLSTVEYRSVRLLASREDTPHPRSEGSKEQQG